MKIRLTLNHKSCRVYVKKKLQANKNYNQQNRSIFIVYKWSYLYFKLQTNLRTVLYVPSNVLLTHTFLYYQRGL